ncbi:MAG: hypothetical protein IT327_21780 [Anaerolineae bacterium]|nr:hypothetical protein [Anaerolineae bacterium]
MLDFAPVILFIMFAIFFVGAVFDVDWIMRLTRAERRYGRKFARIFWGIVGGIGIIIMIIA